MDPNITAAGKLAPAVNWLIDEFAEDTVRPNPQRQYVSVDDYDFNHRLGEAKNVLKKDDLWKTATIDQQGSFTRGTTVYVNIQVQIGNQKGRHTYAHANVVAGEKEIKKDSKEIKVRKPEAVGKETIRKALRQSSSNQKSQWVVKDGKGGYKIVDNPDNTDAKQAKSVNKKRKDSRL